MKRRVSKKILNYNALFTREVDGGYSVSVPALSGCFSQGETLEEAMQNIREAIELYLDDATVDVRKAARSSVNEFIVPIEIHAR